MCLSISMFIYGIYFCISKSHFVLMIQMMKIVMLEDERVPESVRRYVSSPTDQTVDGSMMLGL